MQDMDNTSTRPVLHSELRISLRNSALSRRAMTISIGDICKRRNYLHGPIKKRKEEEEKKERKDRDTNETNETYYPLNCIIRGNE